MTIDHIADLFAPNFSPEPYAVVMHILGRLTALIMWFFVCEGLYYTHDIMKYMLRMGIFADWSCIAVLLPLLPAASDCDWNSKNCFVW